MTPDKAVSHYNAALPSVDHEEIHGIFSDFGPINAPTNSDHTVGNEITDGVETIHIEANSDHMIGHEITDDVARMETNGFDSMSLRETSQIFNAADYPGRELNVGDLVFQRKSARSRLKSDDYWHRLSRVTERIGRKTYMVYDGERVTKQALDNLKLFSVGELLLEALEINPQFIALAEGTIGHVGDFDHVCKNFEAFDPDAHDGDIVWMGYPGYNQMDCVAEFLAAREYKIAFVVFPEIRCARWYPIIDALEEARWFGLPPNSNDLPPLWVDQRGRKCTDPHLTWWIARFEGY